MDTQKLSTLARRLREPSTWAGVSMLLALVGVNPAVVALVGTLIDVAPSALQVVSALGAGGAAVAAIAVGEKGGG